MSPTRSARLATASPAFVERAPASDLEDWLAALTARSDEHGPYYDEAALLQSLRTVSADVSGRPLTVWQEHVREGRAIDVRKLFDGVDLHWLPPEPSRSARLIELDRPAPLYQKLLGV